MNQKVSISTRISSYGQQSEYKIVVLGVASVGKSSITLRFVNNSFSSEYNPTLQDTFRKQYILDGTPGTLEILDTAGQEEYVVMQDHWIREGKGFLIVFALDLPESLEEVRVIRNRIERVKDTKDFPLVIIGNKCDLVNERKISKEIGETISEQYKCKYFETSAKKEINCTEVFMEIVREIRKREMGEKRSVEKKENFLEKLLAKCQLI